MAEAIFDPITDEIKRKKLSIGAPVMSAAPSRVLLQPAHGIDYVSPPQPSGLIYSTPLSPQTPELPSAAPMTSAGQYRGISYVPGEAKVVTPGNTGSSALVGEIVRPSTQTIIPATPIPATAPASPAPAGEQSAVSSSSTKKEEKSIMDTGIYYDLGGGTPKTAYDPAVGVSPEEYVKFGAVGMRDPNLARRDVAMPGGQTQINPYDTSLGAELARARQTGSIAYVPGGNVSVASVSDPAAVEKRREEGRVAIDQLNRTLDRANIMEGAHGPAEAARAQARIAGIDAVRTKGQAEQENAEIEAAKARVSIAEGISRIQKDQSDIVKQNKFDEEADYKANLSALKDPGAAQWLTAARKNVHAGTHEWTDNKITMYDDAGESAIPVKIQGAVPKQFQSALKGTLSEYEQARKLLEENSGLFDSTGTYRTKLLGIQDKFKQMLALYGLRIEEEKL